MTDKEIVTLAHIRQALGLNEKPMLSELPELARRIRRGYDRYEKLCTLNPDRFTQLWKATLQGDNKFDELVDEIEMKQRENIA